jgi:type IV secretory pathway TrbD component
MRSLFWIGVAVGLALWIVGLQRRVLAERRRGDMFRDAAVRLERRAAGELEQER